MKVVVLDRDGVINADSAEFIKTADEFQPMPGSIEAIAKLHKNGFKIFVATNQSGLGRKLFDKDTL
ncbi:MAG: HAD-IIIA family hydrolase, partial [Pseudohongiella sp.]